MPVSSVHTRDTSYYLRIDNVASSAFAYSEFDIVSFSFFFLVMEIGADQLNNEYNVFWLTIN